MLSMTRYLLLAILQIRRLMFLKATHMTLKTTRPMVFCLDGLMQIKIAVMQYLFNDLEPVSSIKSGFDKRSYA